VKILTILKLIQQTFTFNNIEKQCFLQLFHFGISLTLCFLGGWGQGLKKI